MLCLHCYKTLDDSNQSIVTGSRPAGVVKEETGRKKGVTRGVRNLLEVGDMFIILTVVMRS